MDLLLAPEARPFAIATLILVGLVGVEMISLLIGASASEWIDQSADAHGDTHLGVSSTGSTPAACRSWC